MYIYIYVCVCVFSAGHERVNLVSDQNHDPAFSPPEQKPRFPWIWKARWGLVHFS